MRFKSITAQAFGSFTKWQSPQLESGLIVIYGHNESGKSTLFNLALTLLYGWTPASRDKHPYLPWDSAEASCQAVVQTENKQEWTIYRRLRSRPEGTLTMQGKSYALNNGPLDLLASLPREVFAEVYALTADQLRFPEEALWMKLQEQLLGGQYVSFLNPVREVVRQLEQEANDLWRPDRRGKPKDRKLREMLHDYHSMLAEAEKNENYLYEAEAKLEDSQRELKGLMNQKKEILMNMDRFERLYPVWKKYKEFERQSSLAAAALEYEELPQDIAKVLNDIEDHKKHLKQEKIQLNQELSQLEKQWKEFSPLDEMIYGHFEEIHSLMKAYPLIENERKALHDVEIEYIRCQERLADRSKELLQGGWTDKLASIMGQIDEAALRASIEAFKEADQRVRNYKERVMSLELRSGSKTTVLFSPWMGIGLSISSLLLRFLGDLAPFDFISSVLMGMALASLAAWWIQKRHSETRSELEKTQGILFEYQKNCEEALDAVKQAVGQLPVASQWLERPSEALLLNLIRLKDLFISYKDLKHRKTEMEKSIQNWEHSVLQLMDACGFEPGRDILDNIRHLGSCLKGAEERFRKAQQALTQMQELEDRLKKTDQALYEAELESNRIVSSLEPIKGDIITEKIQNLEEMRKHQERSKLIWGELETEYGELDEILEEIKQAEKKGETWVFDPEHIAWARAQRDQLDLQINELNGLIGSLRKELENRMQKIRLDDVQGAIDTITAQRKQLGVRRDQIMLIRNILLHAEKCYREEHQPDVLKKAGKLLEIITEGRYDRLFADETESTGLLVRRRQGELIMRAGPPLSRGTLEQIYIALRLALIQHLDVQGESLPLFLDEVLINWDGIRLKNALRLLQSISMERQVFLFTCHEWLVDQISKNTEAQIVILNN